MRIAYHWFTIFREGREHFKMIQYVDSSQLLERWAELQKFVNR
jgi:hypothetical protein